MRRSNKGDSIVGVISDTHGLVRPEALAALAGSDHVIHGGDVGAPDVLDALARIAPVTAVRGNNDRGPWAERLPIRTTIEIGGVRIHVIHDARELDLDRAGEVDVVVAGHSHRPEIAHRDGFLLVNPGSAGPRRFRLPIAVARLRIRAGATSAEIVPIAGSAFVVDGPCTTVTAPLGGRGEKLRRWGSR
jgi:putative phosphoesterase